MIQYQSEQYRGIIKAAQSKYNLEIQENDDFWWWPLLSVSNDINLLISKVYDNYDVKKSKNFEFWMLVIFNENEMIELYLRWLNIDNKNTTKNKKMDYDKRGKEVITLHSFIRFIEKNLKPCDKLQKTINLHKQQLNDNLVKKFIKSRKNIIAHKSKEQFLKSATTPIEFLKWDELDELVNRGIDICHIYIEYSNHGILMEQYEKPNNQFIQFHQVVLLAPHGMYLNDYKEVWKALRIKNIAYDFLKNIDNIDEYPDDVKAFREEFYKELRYIDN